MHAHEAEEEIVFLADAFLSHVPEAWAQVPAYRAWLDGQSFAPAYDHLHRMLQLLQWQKRRRGVLGDRWVLKTPAHLGYLDDLRAVLPDLHLVHMHRDPVDTIPSGASLNATLHAMHSDEVDPVRIGADWLDRMGWTNDRALATRERWDPALVTDVQFEDAVADPLGQVARVHDAAGLELTAEGEAAMRAWLSARPRSADRPSYDAQTYGLTDDRIRERFAAYDARFRAGTRTACTHPVATDVQHEHELAALDLVQHPTVKAAYDAVAPRWLARSKPSEAMRRVFDAAFEEVMFSAAMWSSNRTRCGPRPSASPGSSTPSTAVACPGRAGASTTPTPSTGSSRSAATSGTRSAGTSAQHRMTENYFTLWDASMGTVDVLNGRTMQVESDGSFVITVDADEAGGRPNHVRSDADGQGDLHQRRAARLGARRPERLQRRAARRGSDHARPDGGRAGRGRRRDDGATSPTSPASSATASARCRPTTSRSGGPPTTPAGCATRCT